MMAGWWLLISHILKTDRGYVIRIMRFGANLARLYRALDARMFHHLQKNIFEKLGGIFLFAI